MDPFIGQIIMFGGNFAPRGWAMCDGQLLPIQQNPALFSILGTTYGGDGRTTFALPDLRGRASIHPGHGAGLTPRNLGQKFGEETVTLNTNQIPGHTHEVRCSNNGGSQLSPQGNFAAAQSDRTNGYDSRQDALMNSDVIAPTGGGQSHDNMQPSLGINYIIALVGVFPSRN